QWGKKTRRALNEAEPHIARRGPDVDVACKEPPDGVEPERLLRIIAERARRTGYHLLRRRRQPAEDIGVDHDTAGPPVVFRRRAGGGIGAGGAGGGERGGGPAVFGGEAAGLRDFRNLGIGREHLFLAIVHRGTVADAGAVEAER